jgi:hypothetical protein
MLEIKEFSKETIYNVMLKQMLAMNYSRFRLVDLIKTNNPELYEEQGSIRFAEDYGLYEAKGLSRALDISLDGIDNLVKLLHVSHWAIFENCKIEKLTDTNCRMRIFGCSTQKAHQKQYGKYWECKTDTMAALKGFCKYAERNIEIKPVYTPTQVRPEHAPENMSCEWTFFIK